MYWPWCRSFVADGREHDLSVAAPFVPCYQSSGPCPGHIARRYILGGSCSALLFNSLTGLVILPSGSRVLAHFPFVAHTCGRLSGPQGVCARIFKCSPVRSCGALILPHYFHVTPKPFLIDLSAVTSSSLFFAYSSLIFLLLYSPRCFCAIFLSPSSYCSLACSRAAHLFIAA